MQTPNKSNSLFVIQIFAGYTCSLSVHVLTFIVQCCKIARDLVPGYKIVNGQQDSKSQVNSHCYGLFCIMGVLAAN